MLFTYLLLPEPTAVRHFPVMNKSLLPIAGLLLMLSSCYVIRGEPVPPEYAKSPVLWHRFETKAEIMAWGLGTYQSLGDTMSWETNEHELFFMPAPEGYGYITVDIYLFRRRKEYEGWSLLLRHNTSARSVRAEMVNQNLTFRTGREKILLVVPTVNIDEH